MLLCEVCAQVGGWKVHLSASKSSVEGRLNEVSHMSGAKAPPPPCRAAWS